MESKREKILKASIDVIHEKRYLNTTIKDIGNRAGIASSLFYHYFGTKEDILFEIVNSVSQDLVNNLLEVEKRVYDPLECICDMVRTLLSIMNRRKEFKIWQEEQNLFKGRRHEICWNHQYQIYNLFKKKLEELRSKDQMNNIDIAIATFSIFGVINWLFRWYKEGGKLSNEEAAENILRFILHGIFKNQSPESL